MNRPLGIASLCFSEAPFLLESASVVGTKEGEGPLADGFDYIGEDDKFGQETWEEAEATLQKKALGMALEKVGIAAKDIRYLFAGDLLGQTIASSFGLKEYEIPFFGLYGACSTCGEALSLASMSIAAGYADYVAAVTSSHFASAEKQFRFPLNYANQRPKYATWTVTGSGAFVLSKKRGEYDPKARITGITTGRIVDYGIKDSMNMGAAMAPAACDLIARHMEDFHRTPMDYDCIVTGDLGEVGSEILVELLLQKGIKIADVHQDCGVKIFDNKTQNTGAGGSGCGCSAVTLSSYYLPLLASGELRRILFVPTGALLSSVSFNEGLAVPGIAHGIVLENGKG